MSSTFKGSFGRKSNPVSDVAPPSYATRPPKNHQKTSNIIDSEEDDEVMPPSHEDRGRSKQVYDIDSDEEEVPAQSERPRTGARSHGGKDEANHNRAAAYGKQRSHHDSERRGTSQALVRREPSLSDEESGPSRGHRGANKSKALTTRGPEDRQKANEKEFISIERFRKPTWREIPILDRVNIADFFEISLGQLRNYVDDGKVRKDNKTNKWNLALMYPLFPPHIVNRVKNEIEAIRREEQKRMEDGRNGKTIIETRFVVPTYRPHNPYLEPYYEPIDEYEDDGGTFILDMFDNRRPGQYMSFGRGPPRQRSPWSHDPLNPSCLCWECEL